MGYENHFTGAITITPPLTWAEIQDGPKLQDVQLHVREEKRTAVLDGAVAEVIVRTCDAIVPLGMEYSGHRLEEDIQAVIDHYGDRGYAGYIEARWDPGFGEPPSRFIVKDDRVMRIDAQYRWPGVWDDGPDVPAGPAPKRMHADELAALLADMAARIPAGDSFGGHISYEVADGPAHEFDVTGMYRIGNRMGQGGMRVIEGDGLPNNKQEG